MYFFFVYILKHKSSPPEKESTLQQPRSTVKETELKDKPEEVCKWMGE